jgi:AraC-like DNA-binding protein
MLEEARHAEALRLLDEPRHSIAQVADALGFASERGFRKAFERWAGGSPSKYRRDGT